MLQCTQALLCLRIGKRPLFSFGRRRYKHPITGPTQTTECVRGHRTPPANVVLFGSIELCQASRSHRSGWKGIRPFWCASCDFCRRGVACHCFLPLQRAIRSGNSGRHRLAGRADDMLKVRGVWVSPIEIERALIEHPAVLEAAVVFRKDKDELPKPVACIVTRNGAAGTPELARELQEFVLSRLPVFKRPHWVEFLPELPKTATGKIQRFKLRTGDNE